MLKNRKEIQQFKKVVTDHYRRYGRHLLPWRATRDPYAITVSEIMLQQTQVPRVIEKYTQFMRTFPTVTSLAKAPLSKVLVLWSGLGYNRRARYLHECAKMVVSEYGGVFPCTEEDLATFPGIGPYTRGAILAFAYNRPTVCIETNIRSVFLHHFFPRTKRMVRDKELVPLIKQTLDTNNPREWYYALMDYGSFLKQNKTVAHRKSITYKKQSSFIGSRRQVRGVILKLLAVKGKSTIHPFMKEYEKVLVKESLERLVAEGLIVRVGRVYELAR